MHHRVLPLDSREPHDKDRQARKASGRVTRELKVFSTIAVQSALETLVPLFEADNGCRLGITWNTAPVLVKRLQGGETADVLILNRAGIDTMTRDRRVRAGSEVTLASSATALAVKAGAPRPDISTPEALKRTLLAARAISYSDPAAGGASGIYFAKLLERLGIAERGQRQDEVSAARRPMRRPTGKWRRRPCRAAETRAASGSRHRDFGAVARRAAHGHGVRRLRGSVERRVRHGPGADRFSSIARLGGGFPRQGTRSGLTGCATNSGGHRR